MTRNTSGLLRGGPGRRPGVPNKASHEVKKLARRLLEDPQYVERLRQRLHRGTAGAIEQTLFHYAYGKPRDVVEASGELRIICEISE